MPHVTAEARRLAVEYPYSVVTVQVVLSECDDDARLARRVLEAAREAQRCPEELIAAVKKLIPDWVRRCRAAGHVVRWNSARVLGLLVKGWMCTTCGKDRA